MYSLKLYIYNFTEDESKIKELTSKLAVMEEKQYTETRNLEYKNNELRKHNIYLVSIIVHLFINIDILTLYTLLFNFFEYFIIAKCGFFNRKT